MTSLDAAFYDKRVSEKIPTSDNPEMAALVDRIDHWCDVQSGDRVLDFGCYDGYVLRKLRERKQIRGVGVDIAPAAIQLARLLGADESLDFIVSDGQPLPFPEGSFDVVVCSEILEHVPDFDHVLDEITRVLDSGGRLYATMPNSLVDVWRPFHALCRRVDAVEGHLRRMRLPEFVSAVTARGYTVARAEYRGFILSAMWYGNVIYKPHIKAAGLRLTSKQSMIQRIAQRAVYGAMRIYMAGDRPFSRYRGGLSIDATFTRTHAKSFA